MHAARERALHKRVMADKRLEDRQLINVNIPGVDIDIPLLDPLLDPIINIGPPETPNQPAPAPTSTTQNNPNPNPNPAPTPTPTPGTTGSGGVSNPPTTTGGGNGSGNTGGGGNSGSGSSDNGPESSDGGSGENSGPGSGSGDASSTGSGNPAQGNSGSSASGPNNSRTGPQTASGGSSSPSASSASNGGGSGTASSAGSSSSSIIAPHLAVNPANDPNASSIDGSSPTGAVDESATTLTAGPVSIPSGQVTSGRLGTGTAGSPNTTGTVGAASDKKKGGLSGGAIAGIVVACLLLFCILVLLLVRRKYSARRTERRARWWFGNQSPSPTWVVVNEERTVYSDAGHGSDSGRNSARSSFATTFDHSTDTNPYSPSSPAVFDSVPPIPPMAEVRDNTRKPQPLTLQPALYSYSRSVNTAGTGATNSTASAPETPLLVSVDDGSNGSPFVSKLDVRSSDAGGGLAGVGLAALAVGASNLHPPPSPMSVRPFSPSESFSFPHPPQTNARDRTNRPSSTSSYSSGSLIQYPVATYQTGYDGRQSPPMPPPMPRVQEPLVAHPTPPPTPPTATQQEYPPSQNPFLDPVVSARPPSPTPSTGSFLAVEQIRRPFVPTLPDELGVQPGEKVRVSRAFDDGWALVEKLPESGDTKGKAKQVIGLIPIDCFREEGQPLPEFLQQKRVSSQHYGGVAV